jgi:hypothetical protein
MDNSTRSDVQILWDYMVLDEPPCPANMLLVLGSVDDGVAVRAAELSNMYSYDQVCFTGGVAHEGDMLQTQWSESEAEHFYHVFIQSSGKAGIVLLETDAQNTGQNARFVYEQLVRERVPIPASIQIVTKPYMERRARATFEAQWPKAVQLFVTSQQLSFSEYYRRLEDSKEKLVDIMVGDFERIMEYPSRGFQSRQEIPVKVLEAWQRLVDRGYNKHLVHK